MTFTKYYKSLHVQLTYFVCSLTCMTSLTQKYSLSFKSLQLLKFVKNGRTHHKTLL